MPGGDSRKEREWQRGTDTVNKLLRQSLLESRDTEPLYPYKIGDARCLELWHNNLIQQGVFT